MPLAKFSFNAVLGAEKGSHHTYGPLCITMVRSCGENGLRHPTKWFRTNRYSLKNISGIWAVFLHPTRNLTPNLDPEWVEPEP